MFTYSLTHSVSHIEEDQTFPLDVVASLQTSFLDKPSSSCDLGTTFLLLLLLVTWTIIEIRTGQVFEDVVWMNMTPTWEAKLDAQLNLYPCTYRFIHLAVRVSVLMKKWFMQLKTNPFKRNVYTFSGWISEKKAMLLPPSSSVDYARVHAYIAKYVTQFQPKSHQVYVRTSRR